MPSNKHGYPIPDDWDGQSWTCRQLWIPDSPRWRAAATGAVYNLTRGRYWDGRTGVIADAQVVAREIFQKTIDNMSCNNCPDLDDGECRTYDTYSPCITYFPNHPDYQPNIFYPFPSPIMGSRWSRQLSVLEQFFGALFGWTTDDVFMTYALPWPGDEAPEGSELDLPSFTFHFKGEGVVELHLLKLPFGGYVIITTDGNPLSAKLVDCNIDWVEAIDLEADFVDETVEEIEVSGTGEHYITVQFAPVPTLEPPWLLFGGGLRRVVMCGEDMEGVIPVPEMRVESCQLQIRYPGGSWQDITGTYDLCPSDGVTPQLRQDPTDPCAIEVSYDGGTEWTTLIDDLCGEDGSAVLLRQNPTQPCKLERSDDGGSEWSVWADLCDLIPDQLQVDQDETDPHLLLASDDGGGSWFTFADMTLAEMSQLVWRQNPDNPCKLEYSRDSGDNFTVFADLSLCGTGEPPDPPPTTQDPQCAAAYVAATDIATMILDITQHAANEGWTTVFSLGDFARYISWSYPNTFDNIKILGLFITLLQHVGGSFDYAPILSSDYDAAVEELAYGAYCAILNTPAPLVPWTQAAWASENMGGGASLVLFDSGNSIGRELLDACVEVLNGEMFRQDFWSLQLTAWSQVEDTTFDCSGSGCGDPDVPITATHLVYDHRVHWVGWREYLGQGGQLVNWEWFHTDQDIGGGTWRRSVHVLGRVPRGDIQQVKLTVTTTGVTYTTGMLRVWVEDWAANETKIYQLDTPLADGVHEIVINGSWADIRSVRVYGSASQAASEGALVGSITLNMVEVEYTTEPNAYDPDELRIDPAESRGSMERLFAQIYMLTTEYEGGGGAEFYAQTDTSGTDCFWVRDNYESPKQTDMSQSVRYLCAGGSETYNPAAQVGPAAVNWRGFLLRSLVEVDMAMLITQQGTES